MAKAGKNNNPSKAGSSNWLSLEDVFQDGAIALDQARTPRTS